MAEAEKAAKRQTQMGANVAAAASAAAAALTSFDKFCLCNCTGVCTTMDKVGKYAGSPPCLGFDEKVTDPKTHVVTESRMLVELRKLMQQLKYAEQVPADRRHLFFVE